MVGLSLVSHVLAGGAHPGAVPLVVLTALTVVALRPLARRELAMPALLGSLGAGQVVLHVAFERCAVLAAGPGQAHHQDALPTPGMVVAHATATLAIAVVLRHGEALLWRLWAWLTGRGVPGQPRVVVAIAPPPRAELPEARPMFVDPLVRERAPPLAA